MTVRRLVARALIVGVGAGCGAPATDPGMPVPMVAGTVVPRLGDPLMVYRQLGFMAADSGIAFVASASFLAGPSRDSTVALFGVSMANDALSFQRQGGAFEARYRIDVFVRRDGRLSNQFSTTERVRVSGFAETQREDESVVFQRIETLAPGAADVTLVVTDETTDRATSSRNVFFVPAYEEVPTLSVVPVFEVESRPERDGAPRILVNPRASVTFGIDSMAFLLEATGLDPGTMAHMRIRGARGTRMWADSAVLRGSSEISSSVVAMGPDLLPPGGYEMEAIAAGVADTVRVPLVVLLTGLPPVTHVNEVLSLLRYFPMPEELPLASEDEVAVAGAWRQFWAGSDPDPVTPVNEALVEYFALLRLANTRFQEAGQPGWLTDRGMVLITLGQPERIEQRTGLTAPVRMIRWRYRPDSGDGVVLDFVGEAETGRFPLAPHSRDDYRRLVDARRATLDR